MQHVAPFVGAGEVLRQAAARQIAEHCRAVRLEAGRLTFPERRRAGQRQQVRQEIGRLVHQVDPELLVLDPGVHVHAADDQARRQRLHVPGEPQIALLLDLLLGAPVGERVGRGGDHGHAELAGGFGHGRPQLRELRPCGADVPAHARADLDLRLQELVRDPVAQPLLAALHELLGRLRHQLAAGRVDEKVFLLEPKRERGGGERHGLPCGASSRSRRRACDRTAVRARPRRDAPPRPPPSHACRSDPGGSRT